MKRILSIGLSLISAAILWACAGKATPSGNPTSQSTVSAPAIPADGPNPKEIPVPEIATSMGHMPGVDQLPVRTEMPDPLVMNDGTRVTTVEQWNQRREEIKRILEYYAVGLAPPPPGNVTGQVVETRSLRKGSVTYRLVKLTFGPNESLSLSIGIYEPGKGGPFPALIMPFDTPLDAPKLQRLSEGATQGQSADALMVVGASTRRVTTRPSPRFDPLAMALNETIPRGYAVVVFNNNDCGEDTTLRNSDGSWAFRTTRFFPAYPGYDWGLLRCWAWGVSRIVDYLQTDPTIDAKKLIVSGVSRTGKSALVAGAFDDRIAMVAPVASSGGGTPAYRFSGVGRGGKEGLSDMMRKYPNWFSPHLHQFWGNADKLPFDEHWFIALCAPRPFIALEGLQDQNVNANGVRQSWLGAMPVYELFNAANREGISWATRPHGMVQGDWDGLLSFADKFLLGKIVTRTFDQFPMDHSLGVSVNVREFGAVGDGKQKDTVAFQTALDQCARAGGGEVDVPAGDYLIGSIQLRTGTTLSLAQGANLLGTSDLADYPIVKGRWEGKWVDAYRGLIYAADVSHIGVVGPGNIVGNPKLGGRQMPRRPCVVEPINCSDVLLQDFSTQQTKMWSIHPTICRNFLARGLTIRSKTGNGDGIDVDSSRNVWIDQCDIDTGDDCISLKSGRGVEAYREALPTENVLITCCKLGDSIFACIGVGSETSGGVHNVRIEHCQFTHAHTYSIYIKSRIGRGASIENIFADDLWVDSATKGFLRINLTTSGSVRNDPDVVKGDEGTPLGKNLQFSNVHLSDCGAIVDAYEISEAKPLDGLTISNVSGESNKGMTLTNMVNVSISALNVKPKRGDLLAAANVSGVGLDGAVVYHPTTMPTTRRTTPSEGE